MKPPDHTNPSGDRAMARGILSALSKNSEGLTTELASTLRLYEGAGDTGQQKALEKQAANEANRLLRTDAARDWRVWLTYHNYHKAPDLLGVAISSALNIPYIIIEPSRSPKQLLGPWSRFAEHAERACTHANALMYMTERDRPALQRALRKGQRLVQLRPFLALEPDSLPAIKTRVNNSSRKIITVAMHRHDVKLKSYQAIAAALELLKTTQWSLSIVGDGPAHADIKSLFESFGDRITFCGRLEHDALDNAYRESDIFIWPGINEAFGMVYLEAQARGLPVVAEDRPGVRDVVASAASLVEQNNPQAFAEAIDLLLQSPDAHQDRANLARRYINDNHLIDTATATLMNVINCLVMPGKRNETP